MSDNIVSSITSRGSPVGEDDDEYNGERCTICGGLFKYLGMSPVEGVCLKCFMEKEK